MAKIIVSNLVSLDGFIADAAGDLSWFRADDEFLAYGAELCRSIGGILFGRRTYEMMAAYWPREESIQRDPIVGERMNNLPKYVVSKTLSKLEWNNSQFVREPIADSIRALKQAAAKNLAVLGSAQLVSSLLRQGLIDEFRLLVHPVLLANGRPEFANLTDRVELTFRTVRTFQSGLVMLTYDVRS